MRIPDAIAPFLEAGKGVLEKGKIGEIIFSEGTYQVEVRTGKQSLWPFLQFDEQAHLLDAFCTCPTSEKEGCCPHIAAAFLRIFNGTDEPLHIRFKKSLWFELFQMAARRHGYEVKVLKKIKKGSYFCESKTKKRLFSIEALTEAAIEKLQGFVKEHPPETEETSLKFSNLSLEEIALYRAGKATPTLRFELSFWSDLAKWFMSLQELGRKYTIHFSYSPEQIPHEIEVAFSEVKAKFYLSLASLPMIIPALKTVDSPLGVFEDQQQIENITYDPKEAAFHIHLTAKKTAPSEEQKTLGVALGEWEYVPAVGFYKKSIDPLMAQGVIQKDKISQMLSLYTKTFEERLKGVPFSAESIKARYQLYFDEGHNLHICCYVFEEGDLQKEGAEYFHPWVYLPNKGFFRLEDTFTDEKEKVIPKDKVGDFVTRHRVWLHHFEGFQTHFGYLQAHLSYVLTDTELKFSSNLEFPDQFEEAQDFGAWVYIRGQGFYMKREGREIFALRPGLTVKKEDIPTFLTAHTDELLAIQGFFSMRCPIEKIGLSIEVGDLDTILVVPKIEYAPGYSAEKVRFFNDYTYVAGEGFFELPSLFKLPEGYREEKTISADQESFFLNYEVDRLKPFTLQIDRRLQKPAFLQLKIRKLIKERKHRKDYWIADLFYQSDIGTADAGTIWQAIIDKKRYCFSEAGLIHLKQPRFNWMRYLGKRRMHRRHKLLKLTTIEWIRLCILENIEEPEEKTPEAEETRKLLRELSSLEAPRLMQISKLKATLRPYQELGLSWLWFMYCHGLSGLLCDEMGLGKTHQAMALLAAISEEDAKKAFKYLVVCPTSVIYHWQELLKRFLPDIRVCTYYGLERTLIDFEEKYDLLLTSYGILRTGRENLKTVHFELAIFDEIQIAKNHRSQTHLVLRDINANMKVGLTGTPIENRIRELKSLFDLVLPNYLPPENVFREIFINPIEKNKDVEKRMLLTKLVKPFILRRKKSDVLLDLPEKMEEISYCDLSDEQRKIYGQLVGESRPEIMDELRNDQKPVPYMHIFSLLSKLKQVCDHPSLILDDVQHYQKHESGKWDLFVELLNEARDSNQKVVVFSQFLGMLAIIESYLKKKGIGFASIKGSTKNRQEQLKRFREDPACEVFVASLLAAGVGIDLSAASIVIHYDRWWNPAKENQATDRVHRLGQSRGVQVFKLVTKGTIEEHVHALIERKRHLIEETIGKDESDQIRFLTREELMNIMQQTGLKATETPSEE